MYFGLIYSVGRGVFQKKVASGSGFHPISYLAKSLLLRQCDSCGAAYSAQSVVILITGGNAPAYGQFTRNAILLRFCMAPRQKSTLLSAVVDKGRRVFGNKDKSTQSLPSSTNPIASPSTTSQKKFKKSNDARHDMSVLAMTYILQDNPTFRELIRLIIGLNDYDDSGKVCRTCNPW